MTDPNTARFYVGFEAPIETAYTLAAYVFRVEESLDSHDPQINGVFFPLFRLLATRLLIQHPSGFVPLAYAMRLLFLRMTVRQRLAPLSPSMDYLHQ